jgi:hypothetical protein
MKINDLPNEYVTYNLAPPESKSFIFNWTLTELLVFAFGLFIGLLELKNMPNIWGLGAFIITTGLFATISLFKIKSRSLVSWLPVILSFISKCELASVSSTLKMAVLGIRVGRDEELPARLDMFRDLDVIQLPSEIGLIMDKKQATASCILQVNSAGFMLSSGKDESVSLWSGILAGLSKVGSDLIRIKITNQSRLGESELLLNRDYDQSNQFFNEVYDEILNYIERHIYGYQCFITLVFKSPGNPSLKIKDPLILKSFTESITKQISYLTQQLSKLKVYVKKTLSRKEIIEVIYQGWACTNKPSNRKAFWPTATKETFNYLRTEDVYHAVFWIAEWPLIPVHADFLSALTINPSANFNFSLIMQPISTGNSFRDVKKAKTQYFADKQLKTRIGYMMDALGEQKLMSVKLRESELAAGHCEFKFSGYISVSANTSDQLEYCVQEIKQKIGQCNMELYRIYAKQSEALLSSLIFDRGLQI